MVIVFTFVWVLSVGSLAIRYVYAKYDTTRKSVAIPENLLKSQTSSSTVSSNSQQEGMATGTNATQIELYRGKSSDNETFEVTNMFPGDEETKYFCIKVYHDADIDLLFRVDIIENTKNLSDVLRIKVVNMEEQKVLCDDSFSKIDKKEFSRLLKSNEKKESIAYYQVTVYLDTSVGNEYQDALLKADFEWYVEKENKPDNTTQKTDDTQTTNTTVKTPSINTQNQNTSTNVSGNYSNSKTTSDNYTSSTTTSSNYTSSTTASTNNTSLIDTTDKNVVSSTGLRSRPKTGDTTNIVLWLAVAVSSLFIIIILIKQWKEDKQREKK